MNSRNIKNKISAVSDLPLSLKGMLLIYALLPVFHWLFLGNTDALNNAKSMVHASLDGLIFYVLPIFFCTFVLRRKKWLLHTYFMHAALLIAYSFFYIDNSGYLGIYLQVITCIVAVFFGLVLMSKDILAGLFNNKRLFRRFPRYRIERLVEASLQRSDGTIRRYTVVLKNWSKEGLRICSLDSDLNEFLSQSAKDEPLEFKFRVDGRFHQISLHLRWASKKGELTYAGLYSRNQDTMQDLLLDIADQETSLGRIDAFLNFLTRAWVRKVIFVTWMAAFSSNIINPSCGRLDVSEDPATMQQQFTAKNSLQQGSFEERILIPVNLSIPGMESHMGLISNLTELSLSITGCVSGLNQIVQVGGSDISLFKYDQNCAAGVNSFRINSETFTMPQGTNFNTDLGAITEFVGDLGNSFIVQVTDQLSPVLTGAESIGFDLLQDSRGVDQSFSLDRAVFTIERVSGPSIEEQAGASVQARITKVVHGGQGDIPLTLIFSGSAAAGSDYDLPAMPINYPEAAAEVLVTVNLIDDNLAEADELLSIQVAESPQNFSYGSADFLITDTDGSITPIELISHHDPTSFSYNNRDKINVWGDISGSGLDLDKGVNSTRPLRVAGPTGSDAAEFDGIDDYLNISSAPPVDSAGPYDSKGYFLVFQTGTDIYRRQLLFEQGDSSSGLNLYIDTGKLVFHAFNTNGPDSFSKKIETDVSPGTDYVASVFFDSNQNFLKMYMFGQLVQETSGVSPIPTSNEGLSVGGTISTSRFFDGSTDTSSAYLAGQVSEFLHYNGNMTPGDIQGIHNTILPKYNFDMPKVLVSIGSSSIPEMGGSTTLTIARQSANQQEMIFDLDLSGTATVGVDVSSLPGSVTLPALQPYIEIPISTIDDQDAEGTETLNVAVSSSQGTEILDPNHTIEILDDELFTPSGDIILWLNAKNDVQTSGTFVTSWLDQINGLIAYETNSSRQPTLSTADPANPSILFDGSNDRLAVDDNGSINDTEYYMERTFALVFATGSDISATQMLIDHGSRYRGLNLYIADGEINFVAYNQRNDDSTSPFINSISFPISENTQYAAIFRYDYPTDSLTANINGQSMPIVQGIGNIYDNQHRVALGAVIGRTVDKNGNALSNGQHFSGDIYEFIYYDEAINAAQQTSLMDYFLSEYGIPP